MFILDSDFRFVLYFLFSCILLLVFIEMEFFINVKGMVDCLRRECNDYM